MNEKGRKETVMDWQAFWLTLRLSALVAAILVVGGTSGRLLDHLLALALEVSAGSGLCLAHRAASDGARLLRSGGAGTAQPPGTGLANAHRSHPGVHFRRPGHRFHPVQPSVCGAAFRGLVRGGGSRGCWRLRRPWELRGSGHFFASFCLCPVREW